MFGSLWNWAGPEAVTDDDHAWGRRAVVLVLGKPAAEHGCDTEDAEVVGRDAFAGDHVSVAAGSESCRVSRHRNHVTEEVVRIGEVAKVSMRDANEPRLSRIQVPQFLRHVHSRRPQEYRIDETEDGGIDADPQRQHEHGHRGERGRVAKRAKAIAKVLQHSGSTSPLSIHKKLQIARAIWNGPPFNRSYDRRDSRGALGVQNDALLSLERRSPVNLRVLAAFRVLITYLTQAFYAVQAVSEARFAECFRKPRPSERSNPPFRTKSRAQNAS